MFKWLIYIIIIAGFISCRVIRPNEMFKTDKNFEFSEFKPSEKEYKIKPFDKLNIRVTTNDGFKLIDISSNTNYQQNNRNIIEYLVEFDGLVKVPTLGRILISGFTIREAEKMLEAEYSKYFQNPFVQISVTNRKVFIFKDGGASGSVINIPEENLTLIEALAQTGGLSDNNKSFKIRLIRGDLNNNPQVYIYNIYNLKDLQKANLILQANDILYVETRPRYASRILVEISPYLNLISTVILVIGIISL